MQPELSVFHLQILVAARVEVEVLDQFCRAVMDVLVNQGQQAKAGQKDEHPLGPFEQGYHAEAG